MASNRKKSADAASTAEPPAVATAPAEPEPKLAAAAYARLADERKALGADRAETPQGDLAAALETARKALPKLVGLRDAIAEALPRHPIAYIDNLEDYILSVRFADQLVALTGNTESGGDRFNEMIDEARLLRKTLLTAAEPLALKGFLEPAKVQAIRSGSGHDDLAADLTELAALYNESWSKVKNKTVVESEEINRASSLGQELQSLLVLRKSDAAKLSPEETRDQQSRAVALLVRAYEENRRAVAYVRWHDNDADQIAPVLFKAKRGRPPKGETTAAPPPVAEVEESKSDELPPI